MPKLFVSDALAPPHAPSTRPLQDCRAVAVFRALQLGDLLCAVPALRALRAGAPDARITLVGLPWALAFAARFRRYVDDFVAFPGAPELPEQPVDMAKLPAFFAEMRARHFDLAIQLHGNGLHTNAIVTRFAARHVAGFHVSGTPAPHASFIPYPDRVHEIRRNVRLVEHLGAIPAGEALEFPLTDGDHAGLAAIPQASGLAPRGYVCLHPGARNPAKRWPSERFAQIGDTLHACGYDVVLTGSGAERALAQAVADAMRAPSLNLALPVSIGAMAALLAGARLVVTNDTGVSHIVAGLRVPSVVVFFATDPLQWAPLDSRLHRTVYRARDVDVATVEKAALELLDQTGGRWRHTTSARSDAAFARRRA